VPLDAYPKIEQGGVVLAWATDRTAAEALRAFVIGEKGRTILKEYGFMLPDESVESAPIIDR
jgi:molybdate transport system substrate-binding protein